MKNLKKNQLTKTISNQITSSTELFRHLRVIYEGCKKIDFKSIDGNLDTCNFWKIIIDGETKQDFAVLKTGEIANGKNTVKYYILKLTN